jgi:TRAP-type transport system periplasmic protein
LNTETTPTEFQPLPLRHPHEWMKAFKAGVESRSNARMKVEIYPANQLGQIPATIEGVALGTIEFTAPAVGFLNSLDPRFQTLDAAGLFDSIEHGQKVLTGPDIRRRLSEFGERAGVEPLITFLNGPMTLVSHRPVRNVADMKGLKLRVPGAAALHVEPFKKVGAIPVSLPLGEVLPALQNKGIDGAVAGFTVFTAFKYYDVARSATFLPGTWLVAAGMVNRQFLKSLGPDLEAIVRDEAKKAEVVFSTYGVTDIARIRNVWESNRGEAISMSAEDARAYLDQVTSVVPGVLQNNSKMKEDYEALTAASRRYRQ